MKPLKVFLLFVLSLLVGSCAIYDYLFAINTNSSINKESFVWKSDTTETVIFYYENGSTAEENIEKIKKFTLNDIKKSLSIIRVDKYDEQITYFLVESRKRMKELIGYEINAGAIPRQNAVYAVYGEVKAIGMHEFNHIIVHNIWGNPIDDWISEGFAVYSDDNWDSYDLHALCKYFLEKGKLASIKELSAKFNSLEEKISYLQSGSFVKYLIEYYGIQKFRKLWDKGDNSFKEIYKKGLGTIEKEWIEELKKCDSTNINYIL